MHSLPGAFLILDHSNPIPQCFEVCGLRELVLRIYEQISGCIDEDCTEQKQERLKPCMVY